MTPTRDRRRVVVGDGLLAALLCVLGLVEVHTDALSSRGPGSPLLATVGVVASAALLAGRRLRPDLVVGVPLVWLAVVLGSSGGVPSLFYGTFLPLLVATYSSARHGTGRTPWVVAALSVTALAVAYLLIPGLHGWSGLGFNAVAGVAAFATGAGLRRSEDHAVAEALRAAHHEERTRQATRSAVAHERARIARDLHDLLGHSMSAMVVQAGAAEQAVESDPEAVRRALRDIRTTGAEALAEVRRVVALIREPGDPDRADAASAGAVSTPVGPGADR